MASKYHIDTLENLFKDHIEDACYFLRKNLTEPVKTVDNNIA